VVLVSNRDRVQDDRQDCAILAKKLQLEIMQRSLRLQARKIRFKDLPARRREKFCELCAYQLVPLVPEPLKLGLINMDEDAVVVERVAAARSVVPELCTAAGGLAAG
jgi:hypothetical protein